MVIDQDLEHYCSERMSMPLKEAEKRLYCRLASRYRQDELMRYLTKLRRRALAYAALHKTLSRPTRHVQFPLLLSSLVLLGAHLVLAPLQMTAFVAAALSASIVSARYCFQELARLCGYHAVRKAVMNELAASLAPKPEIELPRTS